MRFFVKAQLDAAEPVVPPVAGAPVRAALTFAIVALSAPNEERSERIDWICALVSDAACAIGASESTDVAIARPVATAATFASAFVVTVCITIVNEFKTHWIIKLDVDSSHTHFQSHYPTARGIDLRAIG